MQLAAAEQDVAKVPGVVHAHAALVCCDEGRAIVFVGIEEPGAEVAQGFQDGIMPTNYKDTLQPEEIKALTDYLVKVATK